LSERTQPAPRVDEVPHECPYNRVVATALDTLVIGDDLAVARLGFGAMRLTGPGTWGPPDDLDTARRVLRRALELGVNFIDTADSYGPEVNELLIAEALFPYPAGLVIATKCGQRRDGPYQWRADCRPASLRVACEGSLRRLRLDRIDLYQLHTVDPDVPLEESVGALAELQAEGKVRQIGLCNVSTEQLARARRIVPIASVQNCYSLIDRALDDVIEVCESDQVVFIPWMPLARGTLTARWGRLRRIAGPLGATPAQVALAWLLYRSWVTLPIPGTSSVVHLEENVAARGLHLSERDMTRLDRFRPSRVDNVRRKVRHKVRPVAVPVVASVLSLRRRS
jgi:pyridoxine 4-dehydrogenase